jgi:hypothetical protein
MKVNPQFFEYQSESIRSALIIASVFLIAGLFPPLLLLRLLVIACAAGPLWWSFIQLRRRGRGVTLTDTQLLIQSPFIGRLRQVDLSTIQEVIVTRSAHLGVAYLEPPKANAPIISSVGQPALIDARPRDLSPKRRLVVSGPVKDIQQLAQLVQVYLDQHTVKSPFPVDFVTLWAKRRRTRNIILVILALMATPIYAIVLFRFVGLFFP